MNNDGLPSMVQDQRVRLAALISDLENGRITLPDAVAAMRTMRFPEKPAQGTYQKLQADANGDPEVPDKGAFSEVAHAYTAGKLDRLQYEALAGAAAEAINGRGLGEGQAAAGPPG